MSDDIYIADTLRPGAGCWLAAPRFTVAAAGLIRRTMHWRRYG